MEELLLILDDPSALRAAHVHPLVRRAIADTQTATWHTPHESGKISQAMKVSRPGVALADLVFKIVFAMLMRDVQARPMERIEGFCIFG